MHIPGIAGLIAKIPQHASDLPEASRSPLEHYRRGANDAWNLLLYFERNVEQAGAYPAVAEKHARRLSATLLVTIVESFERFAKELIALCVDHVAELVFDDRIQGAFGTISARAMAAHFAEKSLGRALVESSTWLHAKEIHDAFCVVLSDEKGARWSPGLWPQQTDPEARSLNTLFQVRHSIVHNVSVLTRSDAAKLKVLTGATVAAPKVIAPTKSDVLVAKTFLDELTLAIDDKVEKRLVHVLGGLHAQSPLFVPQEKANELAQQFRRSITILGATGTP